MSILVMPLIGASAACCTERRAAARRSGPPKRPETPEACDSKRSTDSQGSRVVKLAGIKTDGDEKMERIWQRLEELERLEETNQELERCVPVTVRLNSCFLFVCMLNTG